MFFFFLIGYLPITNLSAYEEVLNCIQQHLPNSIPNTRYTIPRLSSFINCISYLRCYFELLLNDTFQFNTLDSEIYSQYYNYHHGICHYVTSFPWVGFQGYNIVHKTNISHISQLINWICYTSCLMLWRNANSCWK